jgi:hypothetical protein
VENRRELERSVDEFITRGYTIKSEGEESTRLKKREWGDAGTHLILALITGWWTFGLSNALYAIYKHVAAEEIVIRLDEEADNER